MKFGYSDIISCIKFCDGIDSLSASITNQNISSEQTQSNIPNSTFDRRNTVIGKDMGKDMSNADMISRKFRSFNLGRNDSNFSSILHLTSVLIDY